MKVRKSDWELITEKTIALFEKTKKKPTFREGEHAAGVVSQARKNFPTLLKQSGGGGG